MAVILEGTGLMQGDFLDGVVESTLRGIVGQLKVEYQKELRRALQTATSEAAGKNGVGRADAPVVTASGLNGVDRADVPVVTAPGLNTPEAPFSEEQAGGTCRPKSASDFGLPVKDDADAIGRVWVAPQCLEVERPTGAAPGAVRVRERDSDRSSTGRARGSMMGIWEETMEQPTDNRKSNVVLTKEDTKEIHRLREEQLKVERDAERLARDYDALYVEPVPDEASTCKKLIFNVVASPRFDFGMGFIIILNALTIGWETAITRRGDQIPLFLHILEYSFILLYCVELTMRVYVGGRQAFSNNWVKFDAVIVAAGILNFLMTVASFGSDSAASLVDNVNMIKMIRLFRLAKVVRVFPQFRTLWMLVQGVMYAVMPMVWTALLMSVVIYVFAVIAMEIILSSEDASDAYIIAARNYDTLGSSMLTLMQFMMFDNPSEIYRPLILGKPYLLVYFAVFLLLGPIALLNVVIAIMVESSLRTANEDQDAKKVWEQVRRKEMIPKLRQMFIELDTSGDGEVDKEEVLNAPPHIKETMQHIVGLEELEEIFNLLDYDGSGCIDIDEFCEGIMRSRGEKPSELFVILKQGKATLNRLNELRMRPSQPSSERASAEVA